MTAPMDSVEAIVAEMGDYTVTVAHLPGVVESVEGWRDRLQVLNCDRLAALAPRAAEQRQEGVITTLPTAVVASPASQSPRWFFTAHWDGEFYVTETPMLPDVPAASKPAAPASGDGVLREAWTRVRDGLAVGDGGFMTIRKSDACALIAAMASPTGVAYPTGSDREVLRYLMQQFDAESWECPRCGHSEDCKSMDSADYLRRYLNTPPAGAAPEQGEAARVLAEGWYHFRKGEDGDPDDFDLYSIEGNPTAPCPACVRVRIVSAADAPPLAGQREGGWPVECNWPPKLFTVHDEPGEHEPCWLIFPGGQMLALNHDAMNGVDQARAHFIADTCNRTLARPPSEASGVRDGEVLVTVAGFTGSGKSGIAGEIEILCRALGLEVSWTHGEEEKRLTHADWIGALELYKPRVRIVELNIPRTALTQQPQGGDAMGDSDG